MLHDFMPSRTGFDRLSPLSVTSLQHICPRQPFQSTKIHHADTDSHTRCRKEKLSASHVGSTECQRALPRVSSLPRRSPSHHMHLVPQRCARKEPRMFPHPVSWIDHSDVRYFLTTEEILTGTHVRSTAATRRDECATSRFFLILGRRVCRCGHYSSAVFGTTRRYR